LVYITGGNKTCHGLCGNTTKAWNMATAFLSASSKAPYLASVDCDTDGLLCSQWSVGPPAIYHMLLPASGTASTPIVRYIVLNITSTTATDIAEIHSKRRYETVQPYTGFWHPFAGPLADSGLGLPVAYLYYAFSKMPPWLPMILVSVLSRYFMGNRMARGRASESQSQSQAVPPPAPAARAPK